MTRWELSRPWRVGNHWDRTIIVQGEAEPDQGGRREDDVLVGVMDDADLADAVVFAVNKAFGLKPA